MDGVLVDNLEFHLEAFQQFGKEQGKSLTREAIQSVFGRRNEDMLKALLKQELNQSDSDRFAERKEEIYRELIEPHLHEYMVPGLLDFLQRLTNENFGIALATSGPVENVDFVLDRLDIRHCFNAIVTGDQVTHGKPHPEAFFLAARRIQCDPVDCVVFEDSISGIRAALNGNCKCIAVSTTHPIEEIEAEKPHMIIADFTKLTVADIRSLAGIESWVAGSDT